MTITVTEKRCSRCGETKPVDGFHRNRSQRDGLGSWCKECHRAYNEAHREKRNACHRAYREAHREKRNAYSRSYSRDRKALLGEPTMERWQEITTKHATRHREPWSEAEDAYLAASTDRMVDDALALKRTFQSVTHRLCHLRRRGVTLARDRALAA